MENMAENTESNIKDVETFYSKWLILKTFLKIKASEDEYMKAETVLKVMEDIENGKQ